MHATIAAEPGQHSSARIVSALAQLGGMQAAVAVAALVRNKAMAVYLRPEGFGEFTQMAAIASAFHVLVQSGMSVGLSRNAAAAPTAALRQRQLGAANALALLVGAAALAVALPLLFSPANQSILPALGLAPGSAHLWLLAALLCVAPLEALRNNFMSFLQGVLDIGGLSAARSLAVAAAALLAVPLVALWGLNGACLQMAVTSALLAAFLARRCRVIGFHPLSLSLHPATLRLLSTFGAASLLVGFCQNTVEAYVRGRLIDHSGMAENGLYQAALALSTQVTAVLLGSIGAYSLAAFSQTDSDVPLQSRMDNLLRVVIPASTLGLGLVGLFSHQVLLALYSPQFTAATRFQPLLLAGNHLQVASWAFGSVILARGMIRSWIAVELSSTALRLAVVTVALPWLGVQALPASFALGVLFNVLAYSALCSRHCAVHASPATWAGFALGGVVAVLCAVGGARPDTCLLLLLAVAVLIWPCRRALRSWLESRLATWLHP
jgi:O-antigen/teichoic acid export membrane protein